MHLVDSLKSFNLFTFHAIDLLEKPAFVPPMGKNGFGGRRQGNPNPPDRGQGNPKAQL